ncbi:hypothetical protein DRN84_04560 [Candidatus Geothermarchaeota archaeon]|nr:MAG: hypothetical protein DRN84_04560 [Candidatus Geothermarchaeota archaeon]HEW93931.1 hypothetical protein [Thermoprotei archaeon]
MNKHIYERILVCRAVKNLFLYPDNTQISNIHNIINELNHRIRDLNLYEELLRLMNELRMMIDSIDRELLISTYTSLFITNFPKTLCPPYLHIYTDSDVIKIQYDIMKTLNSLGLFVDKEFKDLPDHISLLIELYEAILYGYYNYKLDYNIVKYIFEKYILPWRGRFSRCLSREDETKVYSLGGEILDLFIEAEESLL